MSEPPVNLTADQRRRLLAVLKSILLLDSQEGRDLLLQGLPSALIGGLARSSARSVDLAKIVEAAERWGSLADGTLALLVVIDNARYHSEGSATEDKLETLRNELTTLLPTSQQPGPERSHSPRLSYLEKAERYRELKEALAARRWQQALDLAGRIRDYKDVRLLTTRANRSWGEQRARLITLSHAYAEDDWAAVLRLARELDPEVPSQVASWVAHAWREVPITMRALIGHRGPIWCIVLHEQRQALSGSGDKTLCLWDLTNGNCLCTFEGHAGGVRAVAVTPDGRQALSASHDKTLRLWDIETGQLLRIFTGHNGPVWYVTITPDGRQALSSSYDTTLRLWDLASGQALRTFFGYTSGLHAVSVTPDGRQTLTGENNGVLKLSDLATGQLLRTFSGHSGPVNAVAMTASGAYAVSGGEDGALKLWDVSTSQLLRTLSDHSGPVNAVAITPDGHEVVSGGADSTVRIWTLPEGLLV